ncbi:MAG: hypothetical protein ACP5HU_06955 [Phycisphaerae bacterium]
MPTATVEPSSSADHRQRRRITWWPMLLIPLALGAALLMALLAPDVFHEMQIWLEVPAPWLVGLIALVYLVRSVKTSNPLYMLLAAMAVVFTLREIHFGWMDKGVYIGAAVVGVWAVLWRRRLAEPLRDRRHTSWLLATIAAYAVAVMIDRRFFQFIPGEDDIHRPLEEWAETAAHLLFLVTAMLGGWRKFPRFKTKSSGD